MNLLFAPSVFIRNSATPLALILLSLSQPHLHAQSATNIAIGSNVIQSGMKRLGMNIGAHNFYDSGQMTKNLVFRNPGFEPQIFQSMLRCATGTATTCTDDDAWSGWPAGFWKGSSYQIVYGAAKGRAGTITNSTVAVSNISGVALTFDSSGTAPSQGDYIIVRKSIPGNAAAGWSPSTGGAGSVTGETNDLPPGTSGVQALRVTAPTSSDSASVASYFDTTAGKSFIHLNGKFQLTFKAKGTGGGNTIQIYCYRSGGANFLNQTINLTSSWSTYQIPFTAAEAASTVGAMNLVFNGPAPNGFLLDDVSLSQTDGSAANTTAYTDAVVNALQAYAPGTLRYWDYQLGETLDNWIAPAFGRKPAGYSAWSTDRDDISIGLHEFLELCHTVGAEPWVVVPVVFDKTQASNMIEYLSGPSSSTYGAKRAARGQSAPWTSVFPKIHLELGNEAWNTDFKGGNMEYPEAYGTYSNTVFGAMRANPNYVSGSYDLIVGGQEAYLGRNQTIVSYANQQDTLTVAGYISSGVDNYANNEQLYGPLFAQPEADNAPGGLFAQNVPVYPRLATYELNMGTVNGSISQGALNQFVPSLGAGLAVADHMLMMMRDLGVRSTNIWQLPQFDFLRADGKTVPLFGAVVDMGNTNRKRPIFQAAALANQVVSDTMLGAVQSGANPTWNQPLMNGIEFSAAHYIQSFAFSSGTSRSIILLNLHRTNSLQVTFSDVNAPSGSVKMQRLQSANIGDTNETAQNVNVVSQQLSAFNPATPYSLPPYTMTVLTWTASTSSTSVAVTPGSVTLNPGANQQLTATVNGVTAAGAVTWSMTPAMGTVSSSGLYTAPSTVPSNNTVLVTATSTVDRTKSATATISLVPQVAVSVSPTAVTLGALQTKQFTASVSNATNTSVNWSISPAVGSISSSGLYTAPSTIATQSTVTVTASSAAHTSSTGTGVITLTPGSVSSFKTMAVNSGGAAATDSAGLSWVADTGFTGVSTGNTSQIIAGTADQALYQTQRWGLFSYAFAIPNGQYQVTLKFAEYYWTNAGSRVFDILLNGQIVSSKFDIIAAAGSNYKAVDRTFTVNVANGALNLAFNQVTDYPAISGIEIVKAPPVAIAVAPASITLKPAQTQKFTVTGGTAPYTWSLSPKIGTISATGLYTAPAAVTAAQTVTLSVTSGANTAQPAVASIRLVPSMTITLNAGGLAYTDPSGQLWAPDNGFTGGNTQVVSQNITGTTYAPLYKSNRWGTFSYSTVVPNGSYRVTLRFAELFWTKPGQRVFNVSANGTSLLNNFDIIAATGAPFAAIYKSFDVTVTNGKVNLQFEPVTDNALVSAIEIVSN